MGQLIIKKAEVYRAVFSAVNAVNQENIATDANVQIDFGTEIADEGGNFASSTFTAPVTDKYILSCALSPSNVDQASSAIVLCINTSNRAYYYRFDPSKFSGDIPNGFPLAFSVVADMDALDTAYVFVRQYGGTAQMDFDSGTAYFMGSIIARHK